MASTNFTFIAGSYILVSKKENILPIEIEEIELSRSETIRDYLRDKLGFEGKEPDDEDEADEDEADEDKVEDDKVEDDKLTEDNEQEIEETADPLTRAMLCGQLPT